MAEVPRSVSRTLRRVKGQRKSTEVAFLWILQERGELTEGQILYVLKVQSTLKLEEFQRALELKARIELSPRSLARSRGLLERARQSTPALDPKSTRREIRRIGVGYRDKGTLRPHHRPREEGPLQIWSEDLGNFLQEVPEEPGWISAEELFGPKQYSPMLELFIRALAQMKNPNPIDLFREKVQPELPPEDGR